MSSRRRRFVTFTAARVQWNCLLFIVLNWLPRQACSSRLFPRTHQQIGSLVQLLLLSPSFCKKSRDTLQISEIFPIFSCYCSLCGPIQMTIMLLNGRDIQQQVNTKRISQKYNGERVWALDFLDPIWDRCKPLCLIVLFTFSSSSIPLPNEEKAESFWWSYTIPWHDEFDKRSRSREEEELLLAKSFPVKSVHRYWTELRLMITSRDTFC